MKYTMDIREKDGKLPDALGAKWKMRGWTARDEATGDVEVVVETYGAQEVDVEGAFSHERGHAHQFHEQPDLHPRKLSNKKWFWVEVGAWEHEHKAKRIDLQRGMMVLDMLNSYRRSLDIIEGSWLAARSLVESWCDDARLLDYEPIEPEQDDPLPHVPGEASPQPSGGGSSGGNSWPWLDEAAKTAARDKWLHTAARDKWLHTEEGVKAARGGFGFLAKALAEHAWNGDNLPPITAAILKEQG